MKYYHEYYYEILVINNINAIFDADNTTSVHVGKRKHDILIIG